MLPLEFFLFLQIILFLFITPGTPRIVIISNSINYGVKNCIWTALGDITANIIQATLVIFFIGSFFSDYPIFLIILKWAGIMYLCYLAYDLYNSSLNKLNSKSVKKKNILSFFNDGFIIAGTSPKAWMFFPFIFPQFIDFDSNYLIQFLILMSTYVFLDFLSLMGYAMLADRLIGWIKANPHKINRISACALLLIAIFIVFLEKN